MKFEQRPWAELVFHVLAHVDAGAHLAPSLFDARYAEQCARQLGPAPERPLGDDALALGGLLLDHPSMVRAQMLAWLFGSVERALSASLAPLADLSPADVDRPELLPIAQGDAAELLFCAALLEVEPWSRLSPGPPADALASALGGLLPLAPSLASCSFASLRPLGARGRVASREIWVGAPGWGLATVERCAWQAAHEAVVLEVCERLPAVAESHDAREELAVALLTRRATLAGRTDEHRRWLGFFAPPTPTLGERLEPLVEGLLSAPAEQARRARP